MDKFMMLLNKLSIIVFSAVLHYFIFLGSDVLLAFCSQTLSVYIHSLSEVISLCYST
jgi:hypothetical protein